MSKLFNIALRHDDQNFLRNIPKNTKYELTCYSGLLNQLEVYFYDKKYMKTLILSIMDDFIKNYESSLEYHNIFEPVKNKIIIELFKLENLHNELKNILSKIVITKSTKQYICEILNKFDIKINDKYFNPNFVSYMSDDYVLLVSYFYHKNMKKFKKLYHSYFEKIKKKYYILSNLYF